MGSESPNAVLYDVNGNEMPVQNGVAIPASTPGLMVLGSDGTNSRYVLVDSSGRQIAVGAAASGAAVAGNPVLIGGSDGTDARSMLTDSSGRPVVVGAGTAGSPAGGVVSAQVPDNTTTGALGALNAAVTLTIAGSQTVGFQLAAGTLIGTIVTEVSFDGGTTWNATYFDMGNKLSSIVFASSNTAQSGTLVGEGGSGQTRVRVSAYTSGTANITLRASQVNDPSELYGGLPGATTQPPTAAQIAGYDSTGVLRVPSVKAASTAPTVSDQPLVVIISPNQSSIPVTSAPATSVAGISFGDVTLSSTGVTSAIERTTYTEQAANFTGSVKSSSANDAAAGTGARTVTIYYVDVTGATAGTETVTLNGTTAVNLVTTTKCFIEKIVVATVGTGASNAGVISLFTGTGGTGTTVGTINAGDNTTFWAHHYVVTGKTCNVTDITHSNSTTVSGGTSTAALKALTIGVANAAEVQISDIIGIAGATNGIQETYGATIKATGPARLRMYTTTGASASAAYRGSFNYYDQ